MIPQEAIEAARRTLTPPVSTPNHTITVPHPLYDARVVARALLAAHEREQVAAAAGREAMTPNKLAEVLRLARRWALRVPNEIIDGEDCRVEYTRDMASVRAAIPLAEAVPDVVEALREAVDRLAAYRDAAEGTARKALAAYDAADK